MLSILLITTLFSISDPQSDVSKNDLHPPSSTVFRNLDTFDLLELNVPTESTFGFKLKIKRLSNPWSLELGFSLPIIEIYAKLPNQPTYEVLLPGSGMSLPKGEGWSYAFKLTGDSLNVYAPRQGKIVDVTSKIQASLSLENNILVVTTNLPLEQDIALYALVGSYDPFSPHGWREFDKEVSPWAFSSKTQLFPVLDILTNNGAIQKRALQIGILPKLQVKTPSSSWAYLTFAGMLLVVLGFLARLWFYKAKLKRNLSTPVSAKAAGRISRLGKVKLGSRARESSSFRKKPSKVGPTLDFKHSQSNWFEEFSELSSKTLESKNFMWDSKEDVSNRTTIDDFKNFKKDVKHQEVIKSDPKIK